MPEKNKGKEPGLLGGAEPVEPEQGLRDELAAEQHQILVENIEQHRCPYHGQDLKIQTEKRTVKKLNEDGFETNETKEITVRFAVCTCVVPKGANPFRGKRVWEKT